VSPDARRRELIARLLGPAGPEVSCEQCFELLDQYVDLELAGDDPDARLPGMRNHLQGCPACAEDHDSLRAFVVAQEAAGRPRDPGDKLA
jgi:anti-sigma factor RsiW